MIAWAYDEKQEKAVHFDSLKKCCSSCLNEVEQGYRTVYKDDPCCCIHQKEYEETQEQQKQMLREKLIAIQESSSVDDRDAKVDYLLNRLSQI